MVVPAWPLFCSPGDRAFSKFCDGTGLGCVRNEVTDARSGELRVSSVGTLATFLQPVGAPDRNPGKLGCRQKKPVLVAVLLFPGTKPSWVRLVQVEDGILVVGFYATLKGNRQGKIFEGTRTDFSRSIEGELKCQR